MRIVSWIMMALISPAVIYGATYTWDGSGDGTTWDTTWQNWSPAGATWTTNELNFATLGSANVTVTGDLATLGFSGSGTLGSSDGSDRVRVGSSNVGQYKHVFRNSRSWSGFDLGSDRGHR